MGVGPFLSYVDNTHQSLKVQPTEKSVFFAGISARSACRGKASQLFTSTPFVVVLCSRRICVKCSCFEVGRKVGLGTVPERLFIHIPSLSFLSPFLRFRSVFNAGCRALLGTINAEQFEREIMRQNVAAPDRRDDDDDALLPNNQDDDFVWVEPEPGVRNPAAVAGGDADAHEPEADYESEDNDTDDDVDGGGDDGGGGAARGAAGARGRKVSGKRARRGFEERKERQEERRLALQALGQEGWE